MKDWEKRIEGQLAKLRVFTASVKKHFPAMCPCGEEAQADTEPPQCKKCEDLTQMQESSECPPDWQPHVVEDEGDK